ncbi:hypothetical protein JG688_00013704 [Phytophthora aleatoria]|uniref:Uncharacterized protein n=1 Tax=Phytophthora aleatoria TaxID=2496075 RepID=A0A8J5LYA5_9STRA|nr:hypothetical protein JG688_00013704 [Phytophthora aleatoria]
MHANEMNYANGIRPSDILALAISGRHVDVVGFLFGLDSSWWDLVEAFIVSVDLKQYTLAGSIFDAHRREAKGDLLVKVAGRTGTKYEHVATMEFLYDTKRVFMDAFDEAMKGTATYPWNDVGTMAFLCNASEAAKDRNSLHQRVIDEETRTIFRWWQWVLVDRLPLSFVERKMTRKNASLPTISEKTLKLNLMRIFESAEGRFTEELPPSFGIVFDGCTFNGRHFIAIFAVFNDPGMCGGRPAQDDSEYFDDTDCFTRRFLLLAFCPFDVEEDLGAQSLLDLIADTLPRYNKSWEAVRFMVADICSLNQYIGSREGARYPQLKSRLSPTAAIVNYVALETGIVKLQWKEPLTAAERVDCADFRRADRGTTDAAPSTQPTSELALAQQAFKKCKTSKR